MEKVDTKLEKENKEYLTKYFAEEVAISIAMIIGIVVSKLTGRVDLAWWDIVGLSIASFAFFPVVLAPVLIFIKTGKVNVSTSWIGTVVTVAFIALRLLGLIDWHWWIVVSPVVVGQIVVLILFFLGRNRSS